MNSFNFTQRAFFLLKIFKEKKCDILTLSVGRLLFKDNLYEEIMQKMCTKS